MRFITEKRVRIYPLLIFVATWTILAINIMTSQGWQGGFGQILGSDFITLYGAGWLSKTDVHSLYDFNAQREIQEKLTELPGLNPYISPPYVALAYSLFTYLPLAWAFAIWSGLSLLFVGLAVHWIMNWFSAHSMEAWTNRKQLLILILSFLPFILGWQVGQNHSLTLLLLTGIMVCTLSERSFLAGVLAGLLLYKPQFILGFLILWLVWRKYPALAGFGLVAALWIGISALFQGTAPYQTYLDIYADLLLLPYVEGFPGYLLVTPYGLLTTALPETAQPIILILMNASLVFLGIGLAWFAYKLRNQPMVERTWGLVLAILYPIIATPYVLVHDLVILIPVLLFWSQIRPSRTLFLTATGVYLSALILPQLSYLADIALVALIPLGTSAIFMRHVFVKREKSDGMVEPR